MNKLFTFIALSVFLSISTECRHHHSKPSVKGRPGDESFEDYLKDAIYKLKLDVKTPADDERKTGIPNLPDTDDDKTTLIPASSELKSKFENKRYSGKSKGVKKTIKADQVTNAGKGRHVKRKKEAPWYKRLNTAHRPHRRQHKTTLAPKEKNKALLNSLKPFIQREVIKDFALVRQIETKLAKYKEDRADEKTDVTEGRGKGRHPKTVFITERSSINLADGKNLLLFGIGVGITILMFILCIIGFHCFRCLKYRDGLFVKNVAQESSSTCKNNNSQPWDRDFLTRERKTDEFSSEEEEIFNVSIPKIFYESLPNSPVIQRSSTAQSTPIKTRKTPLK